MRDITELTEIDIWLAERPDGRVSAYAHGRFGFLAHAACMELLVAECRWTLSALALSEGHDLDFRLEPSWRPDGMPVPAESLPMPVEGRASVTGRLLVSAVRDGSGRDTRDGGELARFLSRATARQGARSRRTPPAPGR
jgi:hypothetical protein